MFLTIGLIIGFILGWYVNEKFEDLVELTGIVPAGINTTAATVASVDATNDAGTGGFNRVITLTWNTSSQGAPITTSTGVLRRTTKVAAYGASGKLHITEIQIAGG